MFFEQEEKEKIIRTSTKNLSMKNVCPRLIVLNKVHIKIKKSTRLFIQYYFIPSSPEKF